MHRGYHATASAVRDRYFWPKMDTDIKKYIKVCPECQNSKIDRQKPRGLLINLDTPVSPGLAYNMDFVTDLPSSLYKGLRYDMALVIVDRCSYRTYILPCRKTDSAESISEAFFDEVVCKSGNGVPLYIVSDRDT
eukprot:SAG11_NODE_14502_length_609_cov_3.054902_1_plen_134_part_10